ncbi:hypothetical protein N7471_013068 [Penicillium samsonianum]|uniref:uncharacterized protein n=1 Tax=Penicillium samsonianum TaxID=1882272 RepID=UPI0025499CBE|nr:uncharacterized protein N7471_013068 [Penicillium samsonianum]KAJ6119117.1 hypothetical protein N7471_013068 [Penicillium samsonianum]
MATYEFVKFPQDNFPSSPNLRSELEGAEKLIAVVEMVCRKGLPSKNGFKLDGALTLRNEKYQAQSSRKDGKVSNTAPQSSLSQIQMRETAPDIESIFLERKSRLTSPRISDVLCWP